MNYLQGKKRLLLTILLNKQLFYNIKLEENTMKKRRYIIIGIFLVLGFLIFNKTLSELKPIPKVTFKSQNLNYDKKEPGSFKVDKSAKWIGEGKAKVTIEVDSIVKDQSQFKDIVFVLDVSGSMSGAKLEQVKKDVKDIANIILSKPRNRAALITFASKANKLIDFTRDIDTFIAKVDSLKAEGNTNYKAGLGDAQKLIEGYAKERDKDLILLFLTDGYPNEDTPNELTVYNELRQTYPYMIINAVQYEMGDDIKDQIKAISNNQYPADMKGLNNALLGAGANPRIYDNFVIKDYISKHFKGEVTKIKASHGEAKLENDEITWDLQKYSSGTKAKLEIELEQIGEREAFYKTNKGIDINVNFEGEQDKILSSDTPVLKDAHKVIYLANAPKGCQAQNLETTKSYRPFEKVIFSKKKPICDGYLFQGYELITEVDQFNKDYIIMPDKDITLKALWSKFKVNKSLKGKVAKQITLLEQIKSESLGNDKNNGIDYSKISSSTNGEGVYLFDETKNDTNPVYFYRGTNSLNNNVIYGDFCWKIVRTTETGGVRLIYNGKPENNKCNTTTESDFSIGSSKFNESKDHAKYVGYMYGEDDTPYENIHDSTIKKYLDKWYIDNIKGKYFEQKLDKKSIYCGDRKPGEKGNEWQYYTGTDRLITLFQPSLVCAPKDAFSVEAGNKKLTYPIGLLTVDEAMMAGTAHFGNYNENYYLYTGNTYYLMSPNRTEKEDPARMLVVNNKGDTASVLANSSRYVRPVITISSSIKIITGKGTKDFPYVI